MYVYACKFVCINIYICIFTSTYVYIYIHMFIYIHTYLHLYIYTHMHICRYRHIHIHIHSGFAVYKNHSVKTVLLGIQCRPGLNGLQLDANRNISGTEAAREK